MIKIRLFCVAGILSSVMVNKMNDAARLKELDVDIQALPDSKMSKALEGVDVVLLGPQIAYKLPAIKSVCDPMGVASAVIPMIDFGLMNGDKILDMAVSLSKEMKERVEREAIEREIAEREEAEREAVERERAEREAAEAAEREAIERERAEREAAEVAEREAIEREVAEAAEREAIERERRERETEEIEVVEVEEVEQEVTENVDPDMIKREADNCKLEETLNTKEYKSIIKKSKELILSAEKEIYISTNIDISVFKDEFSEIAQRGVRLTVVSFTEYYGEKLQIDKLYTYIDEKNKNKDPIIMVVVDDSNALVAEEHFVTGETSNVITDNPLIVSIICKNILNNIYLLNLRDNISFKLKDIQKLM